MRGAIVQVTSSLAVGGAERVALELAAGLRSRGLRSELLVLSSQKEGRGDYFTEPLRAEAARRAVPVRDVVLRSIRDAEGRACLARYFKENEVALVHAHNRPQDWQLTALARLAGIPALYTRHLPYADLSFRQRAAYFAAARSAAAVVAVSKTVAEHLYKEERAPRSKVRLIYNGIDTVRFAPLGDEPRRKLRGQLGLEAEQFAWLCAARLAPQKGQRFLIESLALLPASSRAALLLAGEGPERVNLERLAKEKKVEGRVRFLGDRDDVPQLLATADGYACASLAEGHPLSILEALSAALPVIAPRLSSIEEVAPKEALLWFGPRVEGWAAAHDPAQIVRALEQMEKECALWRGRAHGAREVVSARFGITPMLDAHEALYREVLR